MLILFWGIFFLIAYTYAGYPLVILLLQRFSPLNVLKADCTPSVSVVIAARNEAADIARRLDNLLQQEYPRELLEIILVSDGSTDRTAEIASSFPTDIITVCPLQKNVGKALAVNHGVALAKNEIILFADARQNFKQGAIASIVANFNDPSVGCVSGELCFLQDSDSMIEAEMGAYWKYEKIIRRAESGSGSVVGATGCIYAVRRELYEPLPPGTILDDVLTPMNIARKGKRVLFESAAKAYDNVSKDANQEWRRKVRTLAGNWQMTGLAPWLVSPFANPLFWRFISHKLLRLLVPFMLAILLPASFILGGGYAGFGFAQLAFYTVAAAGLLIPAARASRIVNLCYFFTVMNAAAVAGLWKWASGGCATAWQPSAGEKSP